MLTCFPATWSDVADVSCCSLTLTLHTLCDHGRLDHDQHYVGDNSCNFTAALALGCFVGQFAWIGRGRPCRKLCHLASSFLRTTSSLPQRSSSTSSIWLNQGLCTTLGYVAFTEYEKIGDAMRIQNTVFDVNFVANEVVFQPLHSVTATSLHSEGVNAVRVSRCRLRMVSVPQHDDHRTQQPQLRPPKSMKTLTLCESKADPRWKRVTSARRATTQGPIRERGFTQNSRAGVPKRPLPNCQAGPTASSTPLLLDAHMPWVGTPSWAGPLTTSLRGLWVSGYLPPCNGGPCKRATRKPTRRGRLGPRAGIPKRTRPNCQKKYSQTSMVCVNALRRKGTRRPWSELQSSARESSPTACASRLPISLAVPRFSSSTKC